GHDHGVGAVVELREVLGRVVVRLAEAARVEEFEQRRFRRGELVQTREARAGAEPLADLGVGGPGEVTDERGLATLRPAEPPQERRGLAAGHSLRAFVELVLACGGEKETFETLEQGTPAPGATRAGRPRLAPIDRTRRDGILLFTAPPAAILSRNAGAGG